MQTFLRASGLPFFAFPSLAAGVLPRASRGAGGMRFCCTLCRTFGRISAALFPSRCGITVWRGQTWRVRGVGFKGGTCGKRVAIVWCSGIAIPLQRALKGVWYPACRLACLCAFMNLLLYFSGYAGARGWGAPLALMTRARALYLDGWTRCFVLQ